MGTLVPQCSFWKSLQLSNWPTWQQWKTIFSFLFKFTFLLTQQFFKFFFYCGKSHITKTYHFNYTQWHQAHLYCWATLTIIHLSNLSLSQTEIPFPPNTNSPSPTPLLSPHLHPHLQHSNLNSRSLSEGNKQIGTSNPPLSRRQQETLFSPEEMSRSGDFGKINNSISYKALAPPTLHLPKAQLSTFCVY